MQSIEKQPGCVKAALRILGDKWTPLILQELFEGCQRFSAMQHNLEGISPRTLSQRLDSLEAEGIITKHSFNEMPPRIEYRLTDKGRDLVPILRQMASWGLKYPA